MIEVQQEGEALIGHDRHSTGRRGGHSSAMIDIQQEGGPLIRHDRHSNRKGKHSTGRGGHYTPNRGFGAGEVDLWSI